MSEKINELSIKMHHVSANDIKQTTISDKGANELCLALCDIQIAGSLQKKVFTLADVNRIVDAAIKNGGLASVDGKDSYHGFVQSHEKLAEAAGLTGYTKKYIKFDAAKIFALLQWGSLVELRDEGRHSVLATGWYKLEDKFYCTTSDPWPYTDDKRLDTARAMTQKIGLRGAIVDSRSIEYIGFYVKNGTDWI